MRLGNFQLGNGDESILRTILLHFFRPDGRRRIYCRREECFADACVDEWDRFGGSSVMVWRGFAHGVKSADCYRGQYDSGKIQG